MTNEKGVLEYATNLLCTTPGIRSWGDRGKATGPACPQALPTLRDVGV